MPLSPEDFVVELDKDNRHALERIAAANASPPRSTADAKKVDAAKEVARLLQVALRNEMEATECAAAWVGSTKEVEAKLAFAREAGDEAKHFRLIQKRLAELGVDTSQHDPLAAGRSPLLEYLLGLKSTVERVAAGEFTREALALVRNDEFARFCETHGDTQTAKLYNDVIQPDEQHHHELGRKLLLKLATTDVAQKAARQACKRVLELAEELQEAARKKTGMTSAPGC